MTGPGGGGGGPGGDARVHRPKPAWLRRTYDRYQRHREIAALADLLDGVIERNGLTDEMRACALLLRWPQIVDERIAARTRPDGFFKNVLWIRVANSSWLHELTTLKPRLLAVVREAAGALVVEDIKLHLGDRRGAEADDPLAEIARLTAARRAIARRLPPPPPATGEARAAIERETGAVEDDELREILRDVRIRFDK